MLEEEFAKKVKQAIKDSKLSTEQIAKNANISRTGLWRMKNEIYLSQVGKALRVARELNISLDYITAVKK